MPTPLPNLELELLPVIEGVMDLPPDFTARTDLFDAGLDSMAIMQLIILIEERFGVSLPTGEITRDNFSTVENLTHLLRRYPAAT